MKVNQISHATSYDRYPEIFKEVVSIIPNPNQILSFGCSSGIECNTLHEIYYNNIKIVGLDINEMLINENNINNKYNNIEYTSDLKTLDKKFDLIFVMSVLCRWPESYGEYTFETFCETLNIIDDLLNINGYVCIYNSKYVFTDTALKEKYLVIETNYKETGFVHKYDLNEEKIKDYPYFLFKKIKADL